MLCAGAERADCYAFEDEIQDLVEVFGYSAETTKAAGDFGADVIGRRGGKKVVIQCKLYTKGKIGNRVVSELEGSRRFYDASEAIIVTTSSFTRQAREVAEKLGIHLVDQEMLIRLCQQRNITIPSVTYLSLLGGSGPFRIGHGERLTVGRSAGNKLVVPDPRVSRQHAVFERQGLRLTVTDLGSSNGTRVNERRILSPRALNYGDRVCLAGAATLEVVLAARGEVEQTGGRLRLRSAC